MALPGNQLYRNTIRGRALTRSLADECRASHDRSTDRAEVKKHWGRAYVTISCRRCGRTVETYDRAWRPEDEGLAAQGLFEKALLGDDR